MTAITVEQLRRETERYVREAQVVPIAVEVNGQVVAMLKPAEPSAAPLPVEDRDQLMDSLLRATSHFRRGRKPTREEMNERKMASSIRREILVVLAELSEAAPEVRWGQLIVNLSYLARGLSPVSVWDMEDDELLDAARKHLEQWRAKHGVTV